MELKRKIAIAGWSVTFFVVMNVMATCIHILWMWIETTQGEALMVFRVLLAQCYGVQLAVAVLAAIGLYAKIEEK
jgi:hypothetical protein